MIKPDVRKIAEEYDLVTAKKKIQPEYVLLEKETFLTF